MRYKSVDELRTNLAGVVSLDDKTAVLDREKLRGAAIDRLVFNGVFHEDGEIKRTARDAVRRSARALGVHPASILPLYEAIGRGKAYGFTVPAINIRGLTYDMARAAFRAALRNQVGAVIFEIARSEIGYTSQRPAEYSHVIMGAAIKEGFSGPLFIQGDHFQANAKNFAKNPQAEMKSLKDLIQEAIEAEFFNIDIDSSTLVDLSKPTVRAQQQVNCEVAAELTAFLRGFEPEGIAVSVGGEIGEVGGKNSTIEELEAFMEGYRDELDKRGKGLRGISKISIQTGTSHGGVPLPDGTIARVKLDFETLEKLSRVAREKYGMAGAVQHGASTLPEEAFDHFPRRGCAEIHLATGFQNMLYDHAGFPRDFKEEIYDFLRRECAAEKKEGETDDQFIYKTRKKAFGPLKEKFWNLPESFRNEIGRDLENRFEFLFKKLNVVNTASLVREKVPVDSGERRVA
ncbi:MAG: class II fructose-bisphosphate aldolase [Deltaproteobacteria bacterium]|nr:class II fructose-bisphosphate aldolase [Deltaproteobacteria bacterium]